MFPSSVDLRNSPDFADPVRFSAAACGGDDGNSDSTDNVVVPDARTGGVDAPGGTADAPPSGACASPSSLGTVTPTEQYAHNEADGSPSDWGTKANADAIYDQISIEIYPTGVFTAPAKPANQTYTISGDEANYATCGLCVMLDADIDETNMTQGDGRWVASSGTVTFTSVATTFAGTLSNIHFVHSDIAAAPSFESTPAADGCTSDLTSLTFSQAMTPVAMMRTARGVGYRMTLVLTPESRAKLAAFARSHR